MKVLFVVLSLVFSQLVFSSGCSGYNQRVLNIEPQYNTEVDYVENTLELNGQYEGYYSVKFDIVKGGETYSLRSDYMERKAAEKFFNFVFSKFYDMHKVTLQWDILNIEVYDDCSDETTLERKNRFTAKFKYQGMAYLILQTDYRY